MFASFSAAVFICGGSGITFALSTIQELIQKDQMGQSRVKTMELIWIIQDPGIFIPQYVWRRVLIGLILFNSRSFASSSSLHFAHPAECLCPIDDFRLLHSGPRRQIPIL